MKFGMRKPSIKRSISASTTGKLKRSIKRTINPVYGKRGMGFINNPQKAVYNKTYNMTTFSVRDVSGRSGGDKKTNGRSRIVLSVILICLGLLSLPGGLLFIGIGVLLLVLKSNSKKAPDSQPENNDNYEDHEDESE